jgi:hypothetical protein
MLDLGVRLQLLIGPTIPVPAPYDVVDALLEWKWITTTVNETDSR